MTIKIGRPEDAPKKVAKPHRCNDRVEDVIQILKFMKALFEGFGDYKNTLLPTWSVMWRCFRSAEGDEPTEPYVYLKPDNPAYRDIEAIRKAKSEGKKSPWADEFVPDNEAKSSDGMQ